MLFLPEKGFTETASYKAASAVILTIGIMTGISGAGVRKSVSMVSQGYQYTRENSMASKYTEEQLNSLDRERLLLFLRSRTA